MEQEDLWWIGAAITVFVSFIILRTKNRAAGAVHDAPPRRATSRLAAVTFAEKTQDPVARASTLLTDSRYWWGGSNDEWQLVATQADLTQVDVSPAQRDAMVVVVFDVSGPGLTRPTSRPEAAQLLKARSGEGDVIRVAMYICENPARLESAGFRR